MTLEPFLNVPCIHGLIAYWATRTGSSGERNISGSGPICPLGTYIIMFTSETRGYLHQKRTGTGICTQKHLRRVGITGGLGGGITGGLRGHGAERGHHVGAVGAGRGHHVGAVGAGRGHVGAGRGGVAGAAGGVDHVAGAAGEVLHVVLVDLRVEPAVLESGVEQLSHPHRLASVLQDPSSNNL